MPRVSLDPKNGKFRKLNVLIKGTAATDNKNFELIGRALGVSGRTACRYLESPEKLSLEMLLKLGRYLYIPIEELRECIRY